MNSNGSRGGDDGYMGFGCYRASEVLQDRLERFATWIFPPCSMLMSTISMSGRDCVAYGGRKDGTFVALLTILGNATSMLRQLILQHFCHKNLQIWQRHFCRKILQTLVLRKLLWEFCDTSATL